MSDLGFVQDDCQVDGEHSSHSQTRQLCHEQGCFHARVVLASHL
jgi:hypothetical protein